MDTIPTNTLDLEELGSMANAIRALSMDAVQAANSGHPGMPMGMADVASVLFTRFLSFDPSRPDWPDRDRFVLSAGHGCDFVAGVDPMPALHQHLGLNYRNDRGLLAQRRVSC